MNRLLAKRMLKGESVSLMEIIFRRFDAFFPGRFSKMFSSQGQKANWIEVWAEALDSEGVTDDEIRVGLKAVQNNSQFVPSLGEFIKLCRPPIDYFSELAYCKEQWANRASGKPEHWKNSIFFWATSRLSFEISNYPELVNEKRFESECKLVGNMIKNGILQNEIPKFAPQLFYKESAFDKEKARKRMEEIMKIIKKPAEAGKEQYDKTKLNITDES